MSAKLLDELRTTLSALKPGFGFNDTIEALTSMLKSLASPNNPSQASLRPFQELLTQSLVPLYKSHPGPTLKLSSSILVELFKFRISPLLKAVASTEVKANLEVWEALLRSLFSGIQTYIDDGSADLTSIGNALYKPLFGILSSGLGLKLSSHTRTQAYTMLSDAAEGNNENRELLNHKTILGGNRLGSLIATTNDYLVLDALFHLLARLTPSSSDVGRRVALATEVFQNAKTRKAFGKDTCNDLAKLLENANGREWEKTTEQMFLAMAKADILKPQPFLLVTNKVHANSVSHTQLPPLDHIYVDSLSFIVNVLQDEDSIDCLEVEYATVKSVQSLKTKDSKARPTAHLMVLLSSPPTKGSEPVHFPSHPDPRGDNFTFEIAATDLEAFNKALEARGMKAKIDRDDSERSRAKRSVAEMSVDLNNSHVPSLVDRVKNEAKLYSSSPDPGTHEENMIRAPNKIDGARFLAADLQTEGAIISTPTGPKAPISKHISQRAQETIAIKHQAVSETRKPSSPAPNTTYKTDAKGHGKSPNTIGFEVIEHGTVSDKTTEPENRPTNTKRPIKGRKIANPPPSALGGSTAQKRKRGERADGEGSESEKVAQSAHAYNSQLLQPRETATTRSTTKYKARAKKSPSSPSRISDTDFDAIPLALPSSIPQPQPEPPALLRRAGRKSESKAIAEGHKDIKTTKKAGLGKTSKIDAKKTKLDGALEDSIAVRRTQRVTKKPRLSVIEDSDEDSEEPEATAKVLRKPKETKTVVIDDAAPRALPASEKTKKSKKAPWKDLDQSTRLAHSDPKAKVISEAAAAPRQSTPMQSPYHIELKPTSRDSEKIHAHLLPPNEQIQDEQMLTLEPVQSRLSPVLPVDLEPLDLDVAIARAGEIGMNVGFDFDPVNSAQDVLGRAPSADALEDASWGNETFVTKMAQPGGESVSDLFQSPEVPSTKKPCPPKGRDAIQSSPPVMYSPLGFSPQAPCVRDVDMIDLTHVDDEPNRDEDKPAHKDDVVSIKAFNEYEHHRNSSSISKRQNVTFAHDTKNSLFGNATELVLRSKICTTEAKRHSLIPRPVSKKEVDDGAFLMAKGKSRSIAPKSRPNFQVPEIARRVQLARTPPMDDISDDEESERELNPDEKIVAVLNKIQEVIVSNMNSKFDAPKVHARAAREGILSHTAEDFQGILDESRLHSKNLVNLEAEYAEHGRKAKQGLEDLSKTNEDTDKKLRQVVLDHDRHSLSKKMPKTLVPIPKVFQMLANK